MFPEQKCLGVDSECIPEGRSGLPYLNDGKRETRFQSQEVRSIDYIEEKGFRIVTRSL